MKDIINNENIFRSALIDTSAAEVQAEIERKKFADQAAYKEDELRAEQKKFAYQAADKADEARQAMLDEAEREANKLRMLHEEEQKEALIRYIGSSANIDPQDLMEYIDSLKQSEGMEESQISKGRTK